MNRPRPASEPPMRARALLAVLWLLASALTVPTFAGKVTAQESAGGFTPDERRRIDGEQLVARAHRTTVAQGWIGGVAFQVVDRAPAEVWRALEDLGAYQHMLPGNPQTRDDGTEGNARILHVRQAQMGVDATYSLRVRHNTVTRRVEFELDRDRPHDISDARGFIEVRPYRRRTLVTWAVRTVLGMGAVEPMIRGIIEPWILRVPSTIKAYLEGSGRSLYRE